jgi:asparagine synthase (glutamine-hydrolysing)
MKDYNGREKGLLRYAARGLLPENVLWRKKSPYPKTFDPDYLKIVRQLLNAVLSDAGSPLHQIVHTQQLQMQLENENAWPWYGQLMKLPQTIAYMLQIDCWLRKYNVEIV